MTMKGGGGLAARTTGCWHTSPQEDDECSGKGKSAYVDVLV
jgi:hypothetical protein